ncbi:MAG: galactokinase [Phycisphaerales bacterium]
MEQAPPPPSPERSPPPRAIAARARTVLRERFGSDAAVVATAPGRVNLIGDHTDYNGGFVLPMAIDRVCAVAAAPGTRAGRWRIHSTDLGQDAEMDVGRRLSPGGTVKGLWTSYIAGVAAGFQALLDGEPLPPLDIAIASSVPLGSGLSSSAALEVAVATMLEGVLGIELEPLAKALLCQRAEHEFAGVPCGLMDQFASIHGKAGHALLIDCRDHTVTPIRLPRPEEASFLLIDSGVRHELGATEYAARRRTCESAARKLSVPFLCSLSPPDLPAALGRLTDEEARCTRHAITESARVEAAAAALRDGNLTRLGQLMLESHVSLRDDYRVSCPELDAIVESVAALPGVHGARMTGAGFGGNAVVLAPPEAVDRACDATGSRVALVRPSPGARLAASG